MITLRKYTNPKIKVFYKNRCIGTVSNQTEYAWAKLDIRKSTEYQYYSFRAEDGRTSRIDQNGSLENDLWPGDLEDALMNLIWPNQI